MPQENYDFQVANREALHPIGTFQLGTSRCPQKSGFVTRLELRRSRGYFLYFVRSPRALFPLRPTLSSRLSCDMSPFPHQGLFFNRRVFALGGALSPVVSSLERLPLSEGG